MEVHRTCGEPTEIELTPHLGGIERLATRTSDDVDVLLLPHGAAVEVGGEVRGRDRNRRDRDLPSQKKKRYNFSGGYFS